MVNSWSLAWEVLNGTMDENYPIIDTKSGAGNTAYEYSIDGLDYETDYYAESDIDDMYYHHYTNANSSYNDGWTQEYHQEQLDKMAKTDHNFKYHEDEILKDIQEYVSRTYQGHYT